jgi:hypothetical protein
MILNYHNSAGIAQLVEQLICNQQVPRSIRGAGTIPRAIAQSGSASALGAEGRRFKSCRPEHQASKRELFNI